MDFNGKKFARAVMPRDKTDPRKRDLKMSGDKFARAVVGLILLGFGPNAYFKGVFSNRFKPVALFARLNFCLYEPACGTFIHML